MPDFDLSEYAPSGVAPYTLPIRKRPVVRGRFAGEGNRPYLNDLLRAVRGRTVQISTTDDLAEDRDRDLIRFSKHVIVGWERICDSKTGAEVPFSQEACLAFLRALPPAMVDDLRRFFKDPSNFTEEAVNLLNEALAKN